MSRTGVQHTNNVTRCPTFGSPFPAFTRSLFFLSFFFKIKSNQSPFLLFCCVQSWIQRPLIGKRWQRWQRLISIYSPAVLCRCCFCFFLLLLLLLLSSSSHYTRNAAPMKPTLQQRPTKSSCSRLINNSNEWRWYTVTHTHTQSQKKRKISGATGISSFPLMVGFDFFFSFRASSRRLFDTWKSFRVCGE